MNVFINTYFKHRGVSRYVQMFKCSKGVAQRMSQRRSFHHCYMHGRRRSLYTSPSIFIFFVVSKLLIEINTIWIIQWTSISDKLMIITFVIKQKDRKGPHSTSWVGSIYHNFCRNIHRRDPMATSQQIAKPHLILWCHNIRLESHRAHFVCKPMLPLQWHHMNVIQSLAIQLFVQQFNTSLNSPLWLGDQSKVVPCHDLITTLYDYIHHSCA